VTADGACGTITEVASRSSRRQTGRCNMLDFLSILTFPFVCGLLQVRVGLALELWIKRLEFSSFFICSHGGFIVTPIRCLVK
jgi:hypothetical protein